MQTRPEKLTVSEAAYSPVCFGESSFYSPLWDGAKTHSDCDRAQLNSLRVYHSNALVSRDTNFTDNFLSLLQSRPISTSALSTPYRRFHPKTG